MSRTVNDVNFYLLSSSQVSLSHFRAGRRQENPVLETTDFVITAQQAACVGFPCFSSPMVWRERGPGWRQSIRWNPEFREPESINELGTNLPMFAPKGNIFIILDSKQTCPWLCKERPRLSLYKYLYKLEGKSN